MQARREPNRDHPTSRFELVCSKNTLCSTYTRRSDEEQPHHGRLYFAEGRRAPIRRSRD